MQAACPPLLPTRPPACPPACLPACLPAAFLEQGSCTGHGLPPSDPGGSAYYTGASDHVQALFIFSAYTNVFFAVSHACSSKHPASTLFGYAKIACMHACMHGGSHNILCLLCPAGLAPLQLDIFLNFVTGVYDDTEQRVDYNLRRIA